MSITEHAQREWARLMGAGGAQDRAGDAVTPADLPAPTGVVAAGGRGHVTLAWDPVPGAIGYAVHRASTPDGPFELVDHGGGDVLAVPHGPYADTTVSPEREYWYAVAPLATVNSIGPLSPPTAGLSLDGPGTVDIAVDAGGDAGPLHRPWRRMVGSEHLSHMLCADLSGGRPVGAELRAALRRIRNELGVESVRAHGILCDDLGVYRAGKYDFDGVDRVYDIVCELGMRPVVELSFMPRDLARDPKRTVFAYRGIISPPSDWDRWGELVGALAAHLVERYGRQEVVDHWPFEVWNEANLSVFWSGTPQEYWRLYEVSAHAVKAVDPRIRVGGPASAAVGWIDTQLASPAPVDFLSSHTYGSPPLDLRPLAGDLPLLWTEWGVTASHGSQINDTVFAAAFLLRGMRSVAGRVEALAPWVASDHFEELGRPQRFLHGGFGLLTVGNLAKPKYWALALAQRLGDTELPVTMSGDGAGGLVECWAARGDDGTVGVLVWNTTLDHSRAGGDPTLDRHVRVGVTGLPADAYLLRHWRIDAQHGNVAATWHELGGGDWPDSEQWHALAAADHLLPLEPPRTVTARQGAIEVTLDLPMPAISYLELRPT